MQGQFVVLMTFGRTEGMLCSVHLGCRLIVRHFSSCNAFNQRIATSSTLAPPPPPPPPACCKLHISSPQTTALERPVAQAVPKESKLEANIWSIAVKHCKMSTNFSTSNSPRREQINSFPFAECFWRLLRISPIVRTGAKSTKIRNENLLISTALSRLRKLSSDSK